MDEGDVIVVGFGVRVGETPDGLHLNVLPAAAAK